MPRKAIDTTIRASEADRILQCGAAAKPPKHDIDISGPEALIGRAAHDAIELWIKGGMVDEPQPQPAANRHGVEPDQIAGLIEAAPRMLKRIREDLSELVAETDIKGGGVRGRIDGQAITMAGDTPFSAAVLDWKTGREPLASTKPAQRVAYASAIEATYGMPATGYVYTAELWLATGDILESRLDLDAINGFRARLTEQLMRGNASPGAHCKYCRRGHECKERDAYLRSTATALVEVDPKLATRDALAELYEQSRLVKGALAAYEKALDVAIETGGPLDLGDGRRLEHGSKTIETIDARKAWPVMREHGLDNDKINDILQVGKTKLLAAVRERAPKGEKKAVEQSLLSDLDNAGAIARKALKYRRLASD